MGSNIQFKKGDFASYRAIHDIRVNLNKNDATIYKDSIIEYDGHILKWEGQEYHLQTLRGAVSKGWFVDPDDVTSIYVAERAITDMRPAQADTVDSKVRISLDTTQDEERVVGRYIGEEKRKKIAAEKRKTSTLTVHTPSGEGVVVARLKNPSQQETFQATGVTDNSGRGTTHEILVPRKQVVGIAGQGLEDVFPDAASSSDHYPQVKTAAAADKRAERYAQLGVSIEEEAWVSKALIPSERGEVALEVTTPEPAPRPEPTPEVEKNLVRTSVGIDWDLAPHWRKRVKVAIERYGSSTQILESIMEVEKGGVVNFIQDFLGRNEEPEVEPVVEEPEPEPEIELTEEEEIAIALDGPE